MSRIAVLILLLMSMAIATIKAAQDTSDVQELATPPRSTVEMKNRVPVSPNLLQLTVPKPVERTLSNGITVLILEDHKAPLISMQFSIDGAGSIYSDIPELGSAAATLMLQGTTTRTGPEITKEIARLGATISSASPATQVRATLTAAGLSENFNQWFALAVDILLNPSFPADEWQRLGQNRKMALVGQRSNAGFLATERFNQAVYANHPAGVTVTATMIDQMTGAAFAKWHNERYVPQNTILGIAGDVKPAEIIPKLEKALGSWKKTAFKPQPPANPKIVEARRVFLVDRPASVETTLVVGNIAIDRRSPDFIPLSVATNIIGASPEGRLFNNLREEKGYTYAISSAFQTGEIARPWITQTQVRTDVTDVALTEIFREIQRLSNEPVPAAELEERKRKLVARFAISLETTAGPLGNAMTVKEYGFPANYWDTYPAQVMAVTAADIQRVARKYINAASMQIVAVGNAVNIKTALEKYGPLETYDISGKRTN